ncbi:PAP2 superfamily protein [Chitinophaga jiangningensis]|uniref:PAP2 superfamily protein n=1 Tax=Chitinophaga jiangningensis TaxID=1419482 RepID=A0A1M6WW72_9BACT|nr:phosphatase PAP2 family protein [Chitinophaga jiangningensis]SHK97819.1 PAP2 superfamily protein [Chitinophaga jiangningensis]
MMNKRITGLLLLLLAGTGLYAQEDTTRARPDSLPVAIAADTIRPITAADTTILYRINGKYFKSIWDDTKYTVTRPLHWEKKNFVQAGAIVGLTGVLLASDYGIKQFFVHNQSTFWTSVTDQIEPFGNAYAPYIVAGMYVAGVVTHDRKLESGSLMAAKSLVISTAIYTVIKSVVRRGRPTYYDSPFNFAPPLSGDKQHTSFPSGHSNTVMTVATAIAELYGKDHPWVPWVAYGIAGLTGVTRMYENRHWSSDVLIGMSLGHFVTKSVFRHHRELEHKKAMQLMLR